MVSFLFSCIMPYTHRAMGSAISTMTLVRAKCLGHKVRDYEHDERGILAFNGYCDAMRYGYGRFVMFRVSSVYIFFFMAVKDSAYQFWHFGFKYIETIFAFTIKAGHPQCVAQFAPAFQRLTFALELFVRSAGIPKSLAVAYVHMVDFRATIPKEVAKNLPKTPYKIGFVFCNLRLVVYNLPQSFDFKSEEITLATEDMVAENLELGRETRVMFDSGESVKPGDGYYDSEEEEEQIQMEMDKQRKLLLRRGNWE
jgi:hypothetical protein